MSIVSLISSMSSFLPLLSSHLSPSGSLSMRYFIPSTGQTYHIRVFTNHAQVLRALFCLAGGLRVGRWSWDGRGISALGEGSDSGGGGRADELSPRRQAKGRLEARHGLADVGDMAAGVGCHCCQWPDGVKLAARQDAWHCPFHAKTLNSDRALPKSTQETFSTPSTNSTLLLLPSIAQLHASTTSIPERWPIACCRRCRFRDVERESSWR